MFLDKFGSKNWSSISLLYIFVRYSSISKLLYLCFEFNGYFFKSFLIHIFFWQIWSQNLKFSKLKFGAGVHCYMLITILTLVFSKFFFYSYFLGKFGCKIWNSSSWLKFRAGLHYYMLITILMFIFSNFLPFI